MPQTLKEMLATANAAIEKCEPAAARAMVDAGGWLLDVREAVELERTGRGEGSHAGEELGRFWNAGASHPGDV